jgi:hypothetical protein
MAVLVRVVRDRCLLGEQPPLRKRFAALAATPLGTTRLLDVPAREGHPARQANLGVRWRAVTLRPPSRRAGEKLPPVSVWVVGAVEAAPPAGVAPLAWVVLTTLRADSTTQALQILDHSAGRWAIEKRQLAALDHLSAGWPCSAWWPGASSTPRCWPAACRTCPLPPC